jgi:predicted amidohydrolase YtcJ
MATLASTEADLVIHHGLVHAVAGPHATGSHAAGSHRRQNPTAVAISSGRIVAVGSDKDIRGYAGPRTELIDAAGGTILPGFQDGHAHPPSGGLERTRCDLNVARSDAAYLAAIGAYAAANPDRRWILGGGWAMEAFPGGCPTAVALDAVIADRPVFLPNRDHHSAWVNTAALRLAGLDRDTPDPADGRIERDAAGNPTGALHEGAMALVERILPETTAAELAHGLRVGQAYLHSLGITAWQDAWVGGGPSLPDSMDTYLDAAAGGELTARVVGALWWARSRGIEQVEDLVARRARGPVGRFRPTAVKIMLDGVCETFTAAMLSPYLDAHGHPTDNRGLDFIDPELLPAYVTALDAAGFQVHMHALGDRAVREALDAVAAARATNGPRDNRHQVAHLQVVHPDDVSRFADLDVTANIQALWACADPQMTELTIPYLGEERAGWQYPFASIAAAGGRLALGSDWPVSSPDPLQIMHVATTRTEQDAAPDGPAFLPDQRLTLEQAIYAFTMGSAHTNHHDDVTGSIDVGKLADLVILDRDLFAGPVIEARVTATLIQGQAVYQLK